MTGTLVPQKVDLEKSVRDGSITFGDLLTLLAQAEQEQQAATSPDLVSTQRRPKGKAVALSEATKVALRTIPVELANVVLPAEARSLKLEEAEKLIPLYCDLKQAKSGLEKAEAAIKEAFHNHFDAAAPEDVEVDANGHAISEGVLSVPGIDDAIVRGIVGGKAAGLKESDLAALEADGDIDHKTYLELTTAVPATRTLAPEEKIMAVLAKRPELVKVLAKKARLTPRHTAIRIGKAE